VKNGHVYKIDPIGFYFTDPISLEGQLEYITESLTK
ncbi:iron(3+)-hydroxamate-binding protein fhuD, partial [Bacillus sp. LR--39]